MIHKHTPKDEILKLGKNCRKCGHCCSMGAGFAEDHELDIIAKHLKTTKENLKEKYFDKTQVFNKYVYRPKLTAKDKPFGPCIFLKDKVCGIHEVKPFHCRVGNCSEEHGNDLSEWYTVNCLVDENDPESIRQWNTRVILKPTIKGAKPIDIVGDRDKLKKILEYEIL